MLASETGVSTVYLSITDSNVDVNVRLIPDSILNS